MQAPDIQTESPNHVNITPKSSANDETNLTFILYPFGKTDMMPLNGYVQLTHVPKSHAMAQVS